MAAKLLAFNQRDGLPPARPSGAAAIIARAPPPYDVEPLLETLSRARHVEFLAGVLRQGGLVKGGHLHAQPKRLACRRLLKSSIGFEVFLDIFLPLLAY